MSGNYNDRRVKLFDGMPYVQTRPNVHVMFPICSYYVLLCDYYATPVVIMSHDL